MATILRHAATGQTLRAGKGWKDENGIQHPPNWQIWSAEEKAAAGVTEIVPESPPDSRFYTWSQNADGTINKTAKELSGIQFDLKLTVDAQQGSLLTPTDWMYVRKVDQKLEIPAYVQAWRDSVRIRGDEMKLAIDGAVNINAIEALFVVYGVGGVLESGILYDWPEVPLSPEEKVEEDRKKEVALAYEAERKRLAALAEVERQKRLSEAG